MSVTKKPNGKYYARWRDPSGKQPARCDRLIAESPCCGVKLPRRSRGRAVVRVLTAEEVARIADEVPDRYRALVTVSAALGLRQGEACGLTVDRIDFLRRTVTIDRQVVTGSVPRRRGSAT